MENGRSLSGVDAECTGLLEGPCDDRAKTPRQAKPGLTAPEVTSDKPRGATSLGVAVPDGGWGWIVCLGSFVVNFILDGTAFSFGVLMLQLLSDLGQDKYTTAWIGSVQMGIPMCMGPVISILLHHFSIRQVVMAGSLLASAGFLASVFAPNIYVLIFTYGILSGVGIGMIFLPAVIIVNLYFSSKRAIANGIASSGSGLGLFAYAYVMNILLEHYNWRGAVLILGGVMLNCMVCGLLFRPLVLQQQNIKYITEENEVMEIHIPVKEKKMKDEINDFPSAYVSSHKNDVSLCLKSGTLLHYPGQFLHIKGHNSHSGQRLVSRSMDNVSHTRKEPETEGHSVFLWKSEQGLGEFMKCHSGPLYRPRGQGNPKDHKKYEGGHHGLQGADFFCDKIVNNGSVFLQCGTKSPHTNYTVQTNDVEARDIQTNDVEARDIQTNDVEARDIQTVRQNSQDDAEWTSKKWSLLSLLMNKTFVLLLITFTMWTAQSVTLTYLPDLGVSLGISRTDSAALISVVGISNIIGRLVAGFITDCFHISSIWLYCVALTVAAVANLAAPFCGSYLFLLLFAAVFGLCMAVAVSMRTIVLTEQLGVEMLTESFGIVALFQGIAFTLDPPIAGKLIDDFHSFKPPFFMSAIMYAISALSAFIVGYLNNFTWRCSFGK